MFWKKKNDNIIDLDYETDDKRNAYRVVPLKDFAPVVMLEELERSPIPVKVRDISAGGIAFTGEHEKLKRSVSYTVSMRFPNDEREVRAKLEILDIDAEHVHHCRFVGLSEKAAGIIYRYVLEVQKKQLRARL